MNNYIITKTYNSLYSKKPFIIPIHPNLENSYMALTEAKIEYYNFTNFLKIINKEKEISSKQKENYLYNYLFPYQT